MIKQIISLKKLRKDYELSFERQDSLTSYPFTKKVLQILTIIIAEEIIEDILISNI